MTDARPSFATVASTIGAGWLEKVLKEQASKVGAMIRTAEHDPLRADVRADFVGLRSAANKFDEALDAAFKRLLWLSPNGLDQLSAARKAIKNVVPGAVALIKGEDKDDDKDDEDQPEDQAEDNPLYQDEDDAEDGDEQPAHGQSSPDLKVLLQNSAPDEVFTSLKDAWSDDDGDEKLEALVDLLDEYLKTRPPKEKAA